MQYTDITRVLKSLPNEKIQLEWDKVVCYLPEVCFEPKGGWWHRRIQQAYEFLRNNSLSTARYFRVPPNQIIHVGVRLEI
jgi:K+ transporter